MRLLFPYLVSAVAACGDSAPDAGSHSSRVLWRLPFAPNELFSWGGVPAVRDGRAYWKTMNGLLALDMISGERRWTTPLPIRSLQAPNVLWHDGLLAIADWWGVTVADAETGTVVWTAADTTRRHDTFLDARDGTLFHFLTSDSNRPGPYLGVLKAVDLRTGTPRWEQVLLRHETFSVLPQGVVIEGDAVYAVGSRSLSASGHLKTIFVSALRRIDGALLWHAELPGEFHAASTNATIFGSLLLLGDGFGSGFLALDRTDGHEVWRLSGESGFYGPTYAPLVRDGIGYGVSSDRHAYAFDAATGRQLWTTKLPASAHQLALCGRFLLVENQAVMLLDRTSGAIVDSLLTNPDGSEIPSSGFAVSDRIAAISTDREIVGFSCE